MKINKNHIDKTWKLCFELSIQGLSAGSLGIAAAIIDTQGNVVSVGRNQLFDSYESPNRIVNTIVSHAEINALANLPDVYKNNHNLILFTTVEPCPMCMGAISMSRIKSIKVASKDNWAGSTNLTKLSPYISGKNINIVFEHGSIEKLFTILHLSSLFITDQNLTMENIFIKVLSKQYPEYVQTAYKLSKNKRFVAYIKNQDIDEIYSIILED